MHPNTNFRVGFSADFLDRDRKLLFPDIGLSVLGSEPNISYEFLEEDRTEYAADQLAGYDVLITMKPRVTAAALQGIERLCAIGRCGVGYDNIDLKACTEKDVAVYIAPEGVIRPMAESIVLLVLALSHNLVQKDRMIRKGDWAGSTTLLGREPRDRTIGSVGLGNIASEAIRLLRNFGIARFLAFDPFTKDEAFTNLEVTRVSLEDLLRNSDYVMINCPLTAETKHMIGAPQLRLMKPRAVLVNTARGPIVDQTALIHALESHAIGGAALDVFEKEPLEDDSPLLRLDNVILTSHSVGWTEELFRDLGRIDCAGAVNVSRGIPPKNVVNREVLERPGFRRKLEGYAKRIEKGR
jgi:phosphoglycerate dehydrogenase-like enzyme